MLRDYMKLYVTKGQQNAELVLFYLSKIKLNIKYLSCCSSALSLYNSVTKHTTISKQILRYLEKLTHFE